MPRQKCDNYNLCEKYDCIFGICEESQESDLLLATSGIYQCSPAEKTMIAILASIDDKLSRLLDK